MKRIILILAAGLALTGCATSMDGYYAVQAKAIEADNNAVMALAAAAASGNQGAIMALALRRSAAGQIAVPQNEALQWFSVLAPGGVTGLAAGYWNKQVQIKNIEATTQQHTTTMGTLQGIATGAFNNPTYLPMQPSENPTYLPVTPGPQPLRPVEPTPTETTTTP